MSDALRQSALVLHGLSDTDRQWLLTQLPEEKQALLSEHLQELKQMGLPADRELVSSLLATSQVGNAHEYSSHSRLHQTDSSAILQILANEPAWLIGAVLSAEAWPWREPIYEGLDASKRERVKSALRHPMPAKLRQSLTAHVETRLNNMVTTKRSQANQTYPFERLLGRVKRTAGI